MTLRRIIAMATAAIMAGVLAGCVVETDDGGWHHEHGWHEHHHW